MQELSWESFKERRTFGFDCDLLKIIVATLEKNSEYF